jgi:hypothetical protein
MARARNIKPGLFKNEILGMADPLYTLLFEGLWVLADRDGKLEDRPIRIKAEVFPYRDGIDLNVMLEWLQDNGFIRRYSVAGKAYILVMEFVKHQNPHKNESPSLIPNPEEIGTSTEKIGKDTEQDGSEPELSASTRADSLSSDSLIPDSFLPSPAAPAPDPKGSRLPADWTLPDDWAAWCSENRPDLDPATTGETFKDFWIGKPGKDGRKSDWQATWRNWCRGQKTGSRKPSADPYGLRDAV